MGEQGPQGLSKCGREVNWLDIVSSALAGVHNAQMIAQVVLGEQKFVNTEVPKAIAGVRCFKCKTEINDLRSFKCHNWAYARQALVAVLQEMERAQGKGAQPTTASELGQPEIG